MSQRLCLACLLFLSLGVQPARAADEEGADLIGKDLTTHWDTKGNWALADGVATLTPRPGEKGWSRWDMYLWSKKQYGDFRISFDYMVQKGGNSGFYFRVKDKNDPVGQGIEVQIYDSGSKAPDAKLTDHDSGGIIPGKPPVKNTAKPAGEWNQFVITVKEDKLTVELNGQVVNEVDLTQGGLAKRPKVGYIGFQDHAMPLSIRNVRITELGAK